MEEEGPEMKRALQACRWQVKKDIATRALAIFSSSSSPTTSSSGSNTSSSSSSSSEVSRSVGGKQGHLIWAQQRPSKFSFVIKLLTYNRLHSLTRCLDSLSAADYGTHVIKLHVFIDHFPLSDDAVSGVGGGGGG
eukprot:c20007_g1_i2 orf=1-402(-)